MIIQKLFVQICIFTLLLLLDFAESQGDPPRPTFPDVFQVEVQGIFQDEMTEVDASLYYDKLNNRAVLKYTYQNDTTTSIYDFDRNQLIYIEGVECSVSEIKEAIFFPFDTDKNTRKKLIASPEKLLFFTNSVFDRQEMSIFPSYIYSVTQDLPEYGFKGCEITHIFSKPELVLPNCESHSCKPTLVSISVKCPPREGESEYEGVYHIYNFYRFRSGITDESVFQPPVGVHCNVADTKPIPEFPPYFSFSYELIEEQKDFDVSSGVYTVNKRVWYDSKLSLIRMDEFDEEGLMLSSRIFDFYGQTAYTIVASIPICETGSLEQNVALDAMTRLPKIFFAKKSEDLKSAVYIGKRSVHGLEYDVWTMSLIDDDTDAKVVQEFYFTNNIYKGLNESQENYLQLSHADIYTYEKDNKGNYELSMLTYLSISNFRSKHKEWEAFDISSCFSGEKKKGFSLKVDGPAIVKNSLLYEEVLEKLYMKLIVHTNVSVVRISQLKGIFDGIYISEFTGWILSKIERQGVTNLQPDMAETFNLIEKAAEDGKLTIAVKSNGVDQVYKITAVYEPITKPPVCISGGTFAVVGVILLFMGITIGMVGYYVFIKKKITMKDDQVQLHPVI